MSPTDTLAACAVEHRVYKSTRPTYTEYQRRHSGLMEMERRAEMVTGHPRGRIAVSLAVAWKYRQRAVAPSSSPGDRKFWLGLARSAVARAREDRTKTQPAEARMLALANALPAAMDKTVAAFRKAMEVERA